MNEYQRGYIDGLKAVKVWISDVGGELSLEPEIPDIIGRTVLKLAQSLGKSIKEFEEESG